MSRVLITGASGFVGTPLVRELVAAGEEVHAVGRRARDGDGGVRWHEVDLLDRGALAALTAEVRAERFVHLAWYVEHGRFWSAPENLAWVQASLALLEGFARAGGRRALLVGSCAEYAWGGAEDLEERASPLAPQSLYGVCKDALRRVAEAYGRQVGVEIAWGRLFFIYGPAEQRDRLVPAVIRALLAGEHIATSDGVQERDFMHVEDVAGALAALLQSGVTGPVNIATGRGTPLAEVLDRIGALTGAAQLIERGARPAAAGEPARIVARVRRLGEEVGFTPRVDLEHGLAATVAWWREQDPAATKP